MAKRIKRLIGGLAVAEAAAAVMMSLALIAPASAQFFFEDRMPWSERPRRPPPQAPWYAPRPQAPAPPADFSRAPAPPPRRGGRHDQHRGDGRFARRLAGLWIGRHRSPTRRRSRIVRKHKAFSGLIRYEAQTRHAGMDAGGARDHRGREAAVHRHAGRAWRIATRSASAHAPLPPNREQRPSQQPGAAACSAARHRRLSRPRHSAASRKASNLPSRRSRRPYLRRAPQQTPAAAAQP